MILLDLKTQQFFEKVSSLIHFDCFSSKSPLFGIICLNFQKDSSKQEVSKNFKSYPASSEKLAISDEKRRIKMVLFYFLQQNICIGLHIIQILKHFFFNLVKPGQPADLSFSTLMLLIEAILLYCNN